MEVVKRNENKVYFRLHDFEGEPDEITKKLLLNPTNSWKKGDVIPNRKGDIRRKQSTWELMSSRDVGDSIEDHLESLLNQIEKNQAVFKQMIKKYSSELSIVMYLYDDFNPGINLKPNIIKRIADLELEIDFDIYFLNQS